MEQAFQDYLNEVVAHVGGMPITRRDGMTPAKIDYVRDIYINGWLDGKQFGEDNFFEGRE